MKKYIYIFILVIVPFFVQGQFKSADQFGNLKTVQVGIIEPWNIIGGRTPASDNEKSIYQNASVGIGDFSDVSAKATESLDIAGNARIRGLKNYTDADEVLRLMVNSEGALGTRNSSTTFTGLARVDLKVNTGDQANSPTGTQKDANKYVLYGTQKDVGDQSVARQLPTGTTGYTYPGSLITAGEGQTLVGKASIIFSILNNNSLNPLSSTIVGNRQVILHMDLYKGTTKVRSTKKIISFHGPGTDTGLGTWDNVMQQQVSCTYVVPPGGTGSDYSMTVKVQLYAPDNGNFAADFQFSDPRVVLPKPTTIFQFFVLSAI